MWYFIRRYNTSGDTSVRETLRFTTKIKMIREIRETNPKGVIMDDYNIDTGNY